MVDEVSMLSAHDAGALLGQAGAQGARLVLVGDVDQLASVETGRASRQLQDHAMFTPRLEEIVRQTNPHTRAAVEAMLDGEAQLATSYQPGDIVTFCKFEKGLPRDEVGYRVEAADAEAGAVRLVPERGNTVDAASVYVAISRARTSAAVYTDIRANLTEALGLRKGKQLGAIDENLTHANRPHFSGNSVDL